MQAAPAIIHAGDEREMSVTKLVQDDGGKPIFRDSF